MKDQITLSGVIMAVLMTTTATAGDIQSEAVEYTVNGEPHKGYLVWDAEAGEQRPGVLLVHEWWGHDEFVRDQAQKLARAGYTAFALDMYGEGRRAEHPDEAETFMEQASGDMDLMEERFRTAMEVLKDHDSVDDNKIAAQGYCFGGAVVLNMARLGLDLDGVVSFHGSLGSPIEAAPGDIQAEARVFTGGADPMVPAEQVAEFVREMHEAEADYGVRSFPGVQHSFMNPQADQYAEDFGMPVGYDKQAASQAWAETLQFYDDLF